MAEYRFKAVNEFGNVQSGVQEAANATDLEMRLSRMGLDLINYKLKNQQLFGQRARKVSRSDLINFSFHLEQLMRAGVPLVEALQDLRDSEENASFQAIISQIVEGIEGGQSFSQMLEQFPHIFGDVYASMVRVGERSGRLPDVLHDLAENTKWQDELVSRVRRILIYPVFVATVLFVVIIFVMVYLVPNLISFIQSIDNELPWHTRALLATSDFFVEYWYVIILLPILIPLSIKYAARFSAGFHYSWDNFKLSMWFVGPVLTRYKLARFANYAAMMYASGITVLDLLQLSRPLVNNRVLDQAIDDVHNRIEDGETIANSFSNTGFFPPLVVRMVRVGESSGSLDEAFSQVGYFYGREAREQIERLEQFIGPILILTVALILGWVISSVIGPVVDSAIRLGTIL
ncbi:MAG: type II secretion system F family protein [Pseudomonadota bacterium]